MKHSKRSLVTALLIVLLLSLTAASIQRQNGGYEITWWTVDGGGQTAAPGDGSYTLGSSIGQPDAKVWQDDDYTLTGGFWGGTLATEYDIYLPVILRGW